MAKTSSNLARLGAFPDAVDSRALDEFARDYGTPELRQIAVVIAAYNEEEGIGEVVRGLPEKCREFGIDVIVVADGCGDATAEVAAQAGAYTVRPRHNRGQGAALRLGYQVAAAHGASYVVSTDADGQYDNDELETLMAPLLDGDADFVTGSRRLGSEQTDDPVRRAGVRVFAVLASVLTMRQITDTSFGFRAFSTELATSLVLRQPQYQASELLLSALAHGARYAERPMTMRGRNSGKTKKGNNLVYGASYATVMVSTWWREYVRNRLRF